MPDEQQIVDACHELADLVEPDNEQRNEELFEQIEELVFSHCRVRRV